MKTLKQLGIGLLGLYFFVFSTFPALAVGGTVVANTTTLFTLSETGDYVPYNPETQTQKIAKPKSSGGSITLYSQTGDGKFVEIQSKDIESKFPDKIFKTKTSQREVKEEVPIPATESSMQPVVDQNVHETIKLSDTKIVEETVKVEAPVKEERAPSGTFEIKDAYTDVAHMENGKSVYRMYSAPRQVYETEDGLKLRGPEWSSFYEDENSRLRKKEDGTYSYAVDFNSSESSGSSQLVEVTSGKLELPGNKELSPSSDEFKTSFSDFMHISEFKNTYPNTTVKFEDFKGLRRKSIIIDSPYENLTKNGEVIFWEDFLLPKGAKVFSTNDERNEIKGEQTIKEGGIFIKLPDDGRYQISGAIIFDNSAKEPIDPGLDATILEQTVKVDYEQGTASIGLKVPTNYLLTPLRQYPVTIDPTYYACKSGSTGINCDLVDFFFYNAGMSKSQFLSVGRFIHPGGGISDEYRAAVIRFSNYDFKKLPGTVTKANLKVFYNGTVDGTASSVKITPKRITKSWSTNGSYNYFDLRTNLQRENGSNTVYISQPNNWKIFDVTTSVSKWNKGTSNYGFMLEPYANWTSGTVAPTTWPDRLLNFYSSGKSGSYEPYLEVEVYTPSFPNLSPKNCDATTSTTVKQGETISVECYVKNYGNGPAGSSQLGYYLSTNTEWSLEDTYLDKDTVTSLDPGETSSKETETLTIPANYPAGTAYLFFATDYKDDIVESDEGDNEDYIKIIVQDNGGGGGGGVGDKGNVQKYPYEDPDNDGYNNLEEFIAGTDSGKKDSHPTGDIDFGKYVSMLTDMQADNSAGDPVNTRTGALEFMQTDAYLEGLSFPLNFQRKYDSRLAEKSGRFGKGWTHSYDKYYYKDPNTKNIKLFLGDSGIALFQTGDGGQTYTTPKGVGGSFKIVGGYPVYKARDGISYHFSKNITGNMGMLEKIIDRNGNQTTLTYQNMYGIQMLKQITDPSGRSIAITYGSTDSPDWDKVIWLSLQAGITGSMVQFTYDADGRLIKTSKKNVYGNESSVAVKTFTYDGNHRMLSYTDPLGTVLYNEYDNLGRVTKQYEHNPNKDAAGQKRLIYDFAYSVGYAKDSKYCNKVTTYQTANSPSKAYSCYSADNLKMYAEDEYEKWEWWLYDKNGMVSRYTDQDGNHYFYDYDSLGRKVHEMMQSVGSWTNETYYKYVMDFPTPTEISEVVKDDKTGQYDKKRFTNLNLDSKGNTVKIQDQNGNTEAYAYNANGTVNVHYDKNNKTTEYGYDKYGNITSEILQIEKPDGSKQWMNKNYQYDSFNNLLSYTDPNNNVYIFTYDINGNLRSSKDPNGKYEYYTYDVEDHLVSHTSKDNLKTTYTYDKDFNNNITKITQEQAGVSKNILKSYDYIGNLVKETDANGNSTNFYYDKLNRLIKVEHPTSTEYLGYDARSRLISKTDSTGQKTEYAYNRFNDIIQTKEYNTGSKVLTTSYKYEEFGRVAEAVDKNGGKYSYEYDLVDNLTAMTNPQGFKTTFAYDKLGNLILKTDPLGQKTSYKYDKINRLIQQTDPDNKVTSLFYDNAGNLTELRPRHDANNINTNRKTVYTYDKLNRPIIIKDPSTATEKYSYTADGLIGTYTNQLNQSSNFTYSGLAKTVSIKNPLGKITTLYNDNNGNPIQSVDPLGNKTSISYNSLNKPLKITDPLNGEYKFAYDSLGRIISKTDQLGNKTSFEYDLVGNLIKETDPAGTVTTYTYDSNGNRLTQDIAGLKTSYAYDKLNRIIQVISPENVVEKYTYDANGNVASYTDGNNLKTTYAYDTVGRMTKISPQNLSAISVTLDNWGNPTNIIDNEGTFTYTYDPRNLPEKEVRTFKDIPGKTFTVSRTFNPLGQLASLTDAGNHKFDYTYNGLSLLNEVKYGPMKIAAYAYTDSTLPQKVAYGNGLLSTFVYDKNSRITSVNSVNSANKKLFEQTYKYDAASNLLQNISAYKGGTKYFDYKFDPLGQLTEAKETIDGVVKETKNYTYDKYGNRTNLKDLYGDQKFTYKANQLTNYNPGNYTMDLQYGGNGELKKETYKAPENQGREVAYSWNALDQLSKIYTKHTEKGATVGNPITLEYGYDYAGNRVKKNDNGDKTYYINDGLNVLNEIDAKGNVISSHIYGLSHVAEIEADGKVMFIQGDRLGSASLVTDEKSNPLAAYEYDPFGTPVTLEEQDRGTKYLFTNQESDSMSGLYYYNARYYNPKYGRFISRDPVPGFDGDMLSKNPYAYVKNNPLKYTDPSGQSATAGELIYFPEITLPSAGTLIKAGLKKIIWPVTFVTEFLTDIPTAEAPGFNPPAQNIPDGYVLNPALEGINGPWQPKDYVSPETAAGMKMSQGVIKGIASVENTKSDTSTYTPSNTGATAETVPDDATGTGDWICGGNTVCAETNDNKAKSKTLAQGNTLSNTNGPKNDDEKGGKEKYYMIQKSLGTTFKNGILAGKSVKDVIKMLKNGTLSAKDIPIGYIVRNGKKIIVHNRTFSAVKASGVKPYFEDLSGIPEVEKFITRLLKQSKGNIFDIY